MFRPEPLSRLTLDRIGAFVGLLVDDAVLDYRPRTPVIGFHGGLSPAEIRIPLIVA